MSIDVNTYMIIIGLEGCPRCKILKERFPDMAYIQIPSTSLGFGDTFAKLTKVCGINPCSKCRIRQGKWNKWLPYPWRIKKISTMVLIAKDVVCKLGATQFPVVTDDRMTRLIKDPKFIVE